MTARAALAQIIYEDTAMNELGFSSDNVYGSNSVDTPISDKQFIVISSNGMEKTFGTTGVDLISYWVHKKRSTGIDYGPIDLALLRIRELLVAAEHFSGSDGWVLSAASWVDSSNDLSDDAFDTITKFSTFRTAMRSVIIT